MRLSKTGGGISSYGLTNKTQKGSRLLSSLLVKFEHLALYSTSEARIALYNPSKGQALLTGGEDYQLPVDCILNFIKRGITDEN